MWQRVGDARTAAAQVLRVGCPHIDGPAILGKEVPPLRCSPTRMSIRKGGEREQEGEWEREGEREQGRRFSLPSSSPFLSPSSPLPSDLRPPPPPNIWRLDGGGGSLRRCGGGGGGSRSARR